MALIIAALFFVPWRAEYSDELKWAPVYRNPIVVLQTRVGSAIDTQYVEETGERAYGVYLLQLFLIAGVGALAFWSVGIVEASRES